MSTETHSETAADEPHDAVATTRAYEAYAWVLVFLAGLGLSLAALGQFVLGPLDPTPAFAAEPSFFTAHNFVLLGFGLLTMAVAAVPYRQGQRWAWYALWVVPAVVLGDTATNYSAGGTIWPLDLTAVVAAGLGLLLAVRRFFRR